MCAAAQRAASPKPVPHRRNRDTPDDSGGWTRLVTGPAGRPVTLRHQPPPSPGRPGGTGPGVPPPGHRALPPIQLWANQTGLHLYTRSLAAKPVTIWVKKISTLPLPAPDDAPPRAPLYAEDVHRFLIEAADAGLRLDHFLSARLSGFSRARLQSWIDDGRVTVNGATRKSSWKLRAGEEILVEPAELKPLHAFAEEIPLDILYEDDDVIAIHKPAGLVVHAGAGCDSGTLVNALLHHFAQLSSVGGDLRPGIVHRLDKGTSGVLLVARTDAAHRHLAAQFSHRTIKKVYLALVQGVMKKDAGVIDAPITRDPNHRTRMTARLEEGRSAHTEYTVLERLSRHTLLEVRIGTGRTHQIRVHLSFAGFPIAGDPLYGGTAAPEDRPWLHAARITFLSPSSGREITIEAPVPAELEGWKQRLL